MPVLTGFPQPERVLADALSDLVAAGHVEAETPPELQSRLPFIRIRRLGGGDDRVTDVPRVDIDVYDIAASDAHELAEQIRQRLTYGPVSTSLGIVDRVATEVGPHQTPSPAPDNYRVVSATYRVSLRRR